MSQLKSIVLAIEVATRKRDELARGLARMQKNQQFAQSQMGHLEVYAAETDARWVRPDSDSRSTELIRHHYQFMARLQQAIDLQTGVIEGTVRQVEIATKCLLQAECRLAGLNQVLNARKTVLLQGERRREQQQTDEFAAMQHMRIRGSSISGEVI